MCCSRESGTWVANQLKTRSRWAISGDGLVPEVVRSETGRWSKGIDDLICKIFERRFMRSAYHFSGIVYDSIAVTSRVDRTKLPRYHNTWTELG